MAIEQGSTIQFPNQPMLGSVLAMGFHPHAFFCTFLWIKQILFSFHGYYIKNNLLFQSPFCRLMLSVCLGNYISFFAIILSIVLSPSFHSFKPHNFVC